jgi:hypothetical protein
MQVQVTAQDFANIGETLRGEIRIWQRARQETARAQTKAELLLVINSLKGTLTRWEGRQQLQGRDWDFIRDALRDRIEFQQEQANGFDMLAVQVLKETLGRWEQHEQRMQQAE